MNVQSTSAFLFPPAVARSPSVRQYLAASPANTADTVRISQAAHEALAASSSSAAAGNDPSVEARLAAIKGKDGPSRTQEEQDYVRANDKRLAEITAQGKPPEKLTADELDYLQKAAGFVNTFANLSPAEKALYDKAVASGNAEAAAGISQVAFCMMGIWLRCQRHDYDPSIRRSRQPTSRTISATASSIRPARPSRNSRR
jgi:hypothetical protein